MKTNAKTLTAQELQSIGFVDVDREHGAPRTMKFKNFTVVLRPLYGLCKNGTILGWVSYSSDLKYSIVGHDFSTLKTAVETIYDEAFELGRYAGNKEKAKQIRECLMIENP